MKSTLAIRWIWFKKDWKSQIFWLLFPIIGTLLFLAVKPLLLQEMKVPVGIVMEDDSKLAQELVQSLQQTEYLDVMIMKKAQALNRLERHELDSVFIIKRKYEENLFLGKKRVIEGYSSNRSYAYFAVEELVTSTAQEQATRAKLVNETRDLLESHGRSDLFDKDRIISESMQRQYDRDLIVLQYQQYDNGLIENSENELVTALAVWSILAVLSTLFIFDWVIKEHRIALSVRWNFLKLRFNEYSLNHLVLYTGVLLIVDLLFLLFIEPFSWRFIGSLIAFRCTLTVCAFLIAYCMKSVYMYYIVSIFIVSVCAVVGGGLVPLDGLLKRWEWMGVMNPLYALLQHQLAIGFMVCVGLVFLVFIRRGRHDAKG